MPKKDPQHCPFCGVKPKPLNADRTHVVCQTEDCEASGLTFQIDGWNCRANIIPDKLTPELRHILGHMCFQFIQLAAVYRQAGHDIPKKAEDEQAYLMHRMLIHWQDSGESWNQSFEAEARDVFTVARASSQVLP